MWQLDGGPGFATIAVTFRRDSSDLAFTMQTLFALLSLFVAPQVEAAGESASEPQAGPQSGQQADQQADSPADVLSELRFREVGPYRGGRSAAVTGLAGDTETYYMGAAGGGVFKTTNAGSTWDCISEGYFGGSIGAVAVSDWDPNVVYVGGGEKTVRGNVGHGDGLWRSDDAGKTWRSVGLEDSHHVPRIRVHPRNADVAWAAVLGHLHGPNDTRGVYKTADGGETWVQTLFVDENVGCVDLALDPTNPRVLFASFWRVRRTPFSLSSGGEGSSLWKSIDGGETWTDITSNDGMPDGPIGISGVSVSQANPSYVYAIIEAEGGGVFRSTDGGDTWSKRNSERKLRQRAWYYSRIQADPADKDVCYVMNVGFHRSKDGGRTFERIGTPHSDNHDLWIDPNDPQRMIESNDGGANISNDGGASWSEQSNQPTAQMYRVSTDTSFPYRLLGGQQDNSAIRIRSAYLRGGSIGARAFESTAGGESGHIAAHPSNPDIVFGGSYGGYLTMFNHRTEQNRTVTVYPDNPMGYGAEGMKYRFQWNFPLFFSPHGDSEAQLDSTDSYALYAGSNVLFRSTDLGASWSAISPDLTRNEPSKLGPSGGPITKDNTGVEYYCTIFAAFESPLQKGVIWCGSDDGRVNVTWDDGATWNDVTPEALPEWTQINDMVADPFSSGGAYLAGTRYKLDDFRPYLFHTTDFGATWTDISAGIPTDQFTRAIAADPERRGLLFAGTERGVFASMDDGQSWTPFQCALPVVPVTDLEIKEDDLIVATQGRGFWIMDQIGALRQYDESLHAESTVVFEPAPTTRATGFTFIGASGAGTNPYFGVTLDYVLADVPDEFSVSIIDMEGELIRRFVPKGKAPKNEFAGPSDDVLPAEAGHNRFHWDLRGAGPESFPNMILWSGGMTPPKVPAGRYRAEFNIDGEEVFVPVIVRGDPRSDATSMDTVRQWRFANETGERLTRAHKAIRQIRSVRAELGALRGKLPEDEDPEGEAEVDADAEADSEPDEATREPTASEMLVEQIESALETMKSVEEALYQTKNQSRQDPLNYPIGLTDKLAGVRSASLSGDYAPTAQMIEVADALGVRIDAELERLEPVFAETLPAINAAARALELPFVSLDED